MGSRAGTRRPCKQATTTLSRLPPPPPSTPPSSCLLHQLVLLLADHLLQQAGQQAPVGVVHQAAGDGVGRREALGLFVSWGRAGQGRERQAVVERGRLRRCGWRRPESSEISRPPGRALLSMGASGTDMAAALEEAACSGRRAAGERRAGVGRAASERQSAAVGAAASPQGALVPAPLPAAAAQAGRQAQVAAWTTELSCWLVSMRRQPTHL